MLDSHWRRGRRCQQEAVRRRIVKNYLIWIFIVTLCLSPWPIGGNYPFARTALLLAIALVLFGSGLAIAARNPFAIASVDDGRFELSKGRQRFPKVILVLMLGVAYTVAQSANPSPLSAPPIDQSQSSLVSDADAGGQSYELLAGHGQALSAGGNTENRMDPTGHSSPASIYPPATRNRLVDLLLATGAFIAAVLLLNDRRSIVWTLGAITIVGICVSAFGIVQKLSFDGRIYGVYELLSGGDPFGPFVNGNNAAGFLLITFSASLFFVANQLFHWNQKHGHRQTDSSELIGASTWHDDRGDKKTLVASFLETVAIMQPKHLYFLAAIAVTVAGILMTLSRGGMVSLGGLVIVTFLLIGRTNWKSSLTLAILIIVAGVSIVAYVDRSAAIGTELESFAEISPASEVRLLHWQDAIPFAMENLIWGVGNGTYRYVSPSFQSFYYPRIFAHAESVYIETFVEMGLVGVVLILTTIGLLGYSCIVLLNRSMVFDRSLGIAGIGCLVGQATIGFLDFGIYQPPNSLMTAAIMAMVAGRACRVPVDRSSEQQASFGAVAVEASQPISSRIGVALRAGILFVATMSTLWAAYESWGIESTRLASRQIDLFDHFNKQSQRPLRGLDVGRVAALLATAEMIRPDDAQVQIELGEFKLAQSRQLVMEAAEEDVQRTLEQVQQRIAQRTGASPASEPQGPASDASFSPDRIEEDRRLLNQLQAIDHKTIWATTAPVALHQRLRQAQRKSADEASVIDVFENPQTVELLADAYQRFAKAETACRWLTLPPLRLAQLAGFYTQRDDVLTKQDGLERERRYIGIALERSFTDTGLLYNCGFIALNSGDQPLAVELWAKCLRNPHFRVHEQAIVNLCIQEMPMNLFFEQVLPQNPYDLIRIASKYFGREELMLPKRILLTHTEALINRTDNLSQTQRSVLLAEAAVLKGQHRVAVDHFQSALGSEPDEAPWRLKYARSLYEVEDFDEALRQLKICQLDPSFRQNQVRSLIKKIRRNR